MLQTSFYPRHPALPRVLVRGAGDLATGILQKLWRAGFPVLATEIAEPLAIRRLAALSEAVYEGQWQVEDLCARLLRPGEGPADAWAQGFIPLLIDPQLQVVADFKPWAVIDATLSKRNLDLNLRLAPLVIALGPGFRAGTDCHLVVETMRGHRLGRLICEGCALPNTAEPGLIAGHASDRLVRATANGRLQCLKHITDVVTLGENLALIHDAEGHIHPVPSPLTGLIRGLIRDGFTVNRGLKIGDVDPRLNEKENCASISDKARNIGGTVLEALLMKWTEVNV